MIKQIRKSLANYRRKQKFQNFYGNFIQPGDLCFDIGANMGNRTDTFLDLGATVVSVEPVAESFEVLKERYNQNPKVNLIQCAIGSEPGEKQIHISDVLEVCTISELFIEKYTIQKGSSDLEWKTTRVTEVKTLDQLIANFGIPAFCKIDIEGYEAEAFKGLTQPLPLMSFEYNARLKNIALDCIEILSKFDSLTFNFSAYETMTFSLDSWKNKEEFYGYIESLPEDVLTGDIYVKYRG